MEVGGLSHSSWKPQCILHLYKYYKTRRSIKASNIFDVQLVLLSKCSMTAHNLQCCLHIIASFHSSFDTRTDPTNALTIYTVSVNFLQLTVGLKASLQAPNTRQDQRRWSRRRSFAVANWEWKPTIYSSWLWGKKIVTSYVCVWFAFACLHWLSVVERELFFQHLLKADVPIAGDVVNQKKWGHDWFPLEWGKQDCPNGKTKEEIMLLLIGTAFSSEYESS